MRICIDLRSSTGCHADNQNDASRCRRCGKSLRYALQLHDPGDRVGDYDILGVIGYGAFGAVYRAQVVRMPSVKVALKESFNPQSVRAFSDEFQLLARLQHPNLPRYFDIFEADDNGYLVMEFVPGQSLEQVQQRQRTALAEPQVLGYAVQLCDVLSYLHQQQPTIIHRDIKPANIRVTPAGLIKLVDFGLVKQGDEATRLSRRGLTPAYAPPEQWGDGNGTSPRSDLYSLGATLYHLISGEKPATATERISATVDPLRSPIAVKPEITAHVSDAIVVAMSLRQEERYADATDMRRSLLGSPIQTAVPIKPVIAPLRAPARLEQTLEGHSSFVWSVAYSPDAKLIASSGSDQTIRLWDAATGTMVRLLELRGFMNSANAVTFSPDGERIAVGANDGQIWIWCVADGSTTAVLRGHTAPVTSVAFSPDGRTLASASNDTTVRLWRAHDGQPLRAFYGHTQVVHSIAWSPDSNLIASAGGSGAVALDRTIRIWQPDDGRVVRTLEGHTSNINSIAWSHDASLLASCGGDRIVRVWRTHDGGEALLLNAEQVRGAGGAVAFSPDSQLLASGHWDNTVRLWRVGTGELITTLSEHTDFVKSVVFSPDGTQIVSGGDDRTVRVWSV
jgi:eukaryotic-like serine/threonine-protein kinase